MIKSDVMTQFGYADQNAFDTLLLDLGIDPDKVELNEDECERIRQHATEMGANKALPSSQNESSNGHIAVTDDDVLDLVESTGVDLDIVMNAAAHVEDLEALVHWVEEYVRLESEQAIKDSARQQFKLDQLRKKETELSERLNSAMTKPAPNVSKIRQRLGVTVPQTVSKLGSWDGTVGGKNEPDFLKAARSKFQTGNR